VTRNIQIERACWRRALQSKRTDVSVSIRQVFYSPPMFLDEHILRNVVGDSGCPDGLAEGASPPRAVRRDLPDSLWNNSVNVYGGEGPKHPGKEGRLVAGERWSSSCVGLKLAGRKVRSLAGLHKR
jgi:hypothetical protein